MSHRVFKAPMPIILQHTNSDWLFIYEKDFDVFDSDYNFSTIFGLLFQFTAQKYSLSATEKSSPKTSRNMLSKCSVLSNLEDMSRYRNCKHLKAVLDLSCTYYLFMRSS